MINYTFPFPLTLAAGVPIPGYNTEAQGQKRCLFQKGPRNQTSEKTGPALHLGSFWNKRGRGSWARLQEEPKNLQKCGHSHRESSRSAT